MCMILLKPEANNVSTGGSKQPLKKRLSFSRSKMEVLVLVLLYKRNYQAQYHWISHTQSHHPKLEMAQSNTHTSLSWSQDNPEQQNFNGKFIPSSTGAYDIRLFAFHSLASLMVRMMKCRRWKSKPSITT